MEEAYKVARRVAGKSSARGKTHYDRRVHSSVLHPGDQVLVRNLSETGGPGKLRAYWENDVHIVVKRLGDDSPVYELHPESGKGRKRTLHRNLLLPCDDLIQEGQDESQPYSAHRARRRRTQEPGPQPATCTKRHAQGTALEESDSDSPDEGCLIQL